MLEICELPTTTCRATYKTHFDAAKTRMKALQNTANKCTELKCYESEATASASLYILVHIPMHTSYIATPRQIDAPYLFRRLYKIFCMRIAYFIYTNTKKFACACTRL